MTTLSSRLKAATGQRYARFDGGGYGAVRARMPSADVAFTTAADLRDRGFDAGAREDRVGHYVVVRQAVEMAGGEQ